jgi:hypothetical protein
MKVWKRIYNDALSVLTVLLMLAVTVLFFVTLAGATPIEGDYCPDRMKPVFVCDPLQQCWYECRGEGGRIDPTTRTSVDPDQPGADPETPDNAAGNPGNAKSVGKAGEKGMDNESPRSGTKGRSGEKGGKKK